MNEKELGRALLSGEGARRDVDAAELTRRVLRRDRRRVWVLGAVCVVAWMAVVMLPWATVLPALAKVQMQVAAAQAGGGTGGVGQEEMAGFGRAVVATFIESVASMLLAAVCTVALVVTTRRATLRQVHARLGEISEQLKALAERRG